MKATILAVVIVALLFGGRMVCGQTQQGATNASMSVAELMRLLPSGPDMDSPSDLQKWQSLRSQGASLLPVIADALDHSTNTMEIGRLVGLALEIQGDHSKLRPRLYVLLNGEETVKMIGVRALQKIGSVDDCPRLLPLLQDPSEAIRINTARALANLGDDKALEEMTRVLEKRRAKLNAEELRRDYSISEIEKAITVLQKKTKRFEK